MEIRALPSELQQIAEAELNEVPSRLPDAIKDLRDWLSQQPHLFAKTDDQWLLTFLRSCKFDLQKTKEKIDLFYTARTLLPEFFSNRNPFLPAIQEILNLGIVLPLPKLESAPRIILIRGSVWDLKIPFNALAKTILMIVDILMCEDDSFIICGCHGLVDMTNMAVDHLLRVNANELARYEVCLEKAYPIKTAKIDLVNTPQPVEMIFFMMKAFMPEGLVSKINIHYENKSDNVYKDIPSSILPKEYGGEGDTLADLTEYWKHKVESYKGWFKEDAQYCTDETKRSGNPKTTTDVFGAEASLRNLSLD